MFEEKLECSDLILSRYLESVSGEPLTLTQQARCFRNLLKEHQSQLRVFKTFAKNQSFDELKTYLSELNQKWESGREAFYFMYDRLSHALAGFFSMKREGDTANVYVFVADDFKGRRYSQKAWEMVEKSFFENHACQSIYCICHHRNETFNRMLETSKKRGYRSVFEPFCFEGHSYSSQDFGIWVKTREDYQKEQGLKSFITHSKIRIFPSSFEHTKE